MNMLIFLLRQLLKLRYKLQLRKIEVLEQGRPCILLPNHQALVDPQLLVTSIYNKVNVLPAVTAAYYDMPVLNRIFRRWGAIRVDDLKAGSRNTGIVHSITAPMVAGLEQGRCAILYPSGQLCPDGKEFIQYKQSAYELLKHAPAGTKVIAVRIEGLWGSTWSKYATGHTPGFALRIAASALWCIAGLVFFMPKRKVVITFDDITELAHSASAKGLRSFNIMLEQHFNSSVSPEPLLVKMHHLCHEPKPRDEKNMPLPVSQEISDIEIPPGILEIVRRCISTQLPAPADIQPEHELEHELGLDSLGMINVIDLIEKETGVQFPPNLDQVATVRHLCALAMGYADVRISYKPIWRNDEVPSAQRFTVETGATILQCALKRIGSKRSRPLMWDNTLGQSTRRQALLKAYVIAGIIDAQTSCKHIGIMLPAAQSASILVLACYIAKKIPVMFNWTVGHDSLQKCFSASGCDRILTASAFYSKVADKIPASMEGCFCMLDKEAPNIGAAQKITALAKYLSKWKPLIASPSDCAVVLFTSGSETSPKAVPLSHSNITENLKAVFETVEISDNQVFLSFLPPFHSFGFTVFTILPLISGCRVAYTPDPTNANEIIRVLKHSAANVLIGTPTFLRNVIQRAEQADIGSLRYIVSGAEAMPAELHEMAALKTNGAYLLEGYGITECSPVISINPLDKQKKGSVGKLLPCLEALVANPETMDICAPGDEGMLLVRGASVFAGYQDSEIEHPFEMINGKEYYKTGDIVRIDREGYIFIVGRLKRFLKSGGEMLSLPYLEATLNRIFAIDGHQGIAVEGREKDSGASISAFTPLPLDVHTVNKAIRDAGLSNIYQIKHLVPVTELPLLGSGKIDYKLLRNMCP
jgi:acyl-CoA synthetase (AMP-forming)/AMP-acid ligase II/1-acyl-sn-glycerol-3-phosphate acyltransferase/acyl carrier protein